MKLIFSQITTKDNIDFNGKTPQQKIMEELDFYAGQAKKIKENIIKRKAKKKKKKCTPGQTTGPCSGKLDTQLFPKWWKAHPMKAEANAKAKAMFFKKEIEKDSYWVVQYQNEEAKLTIEELFPSNAYDTNQIKSKDFGIALILRLSKGNLKEEAQKIINENKLQYKDISAEDIMDKEKITHLVSYAIPLNDYQKNIRDALEEKITWELEQ